MAVQWIGPYRILGKLGAGAMGQVYLADDPRLRRRIAIKTVADHRAGNPDARRRLLREARAAARLTHPNVAAIYDVVETDDGVHIVMEYVRGETLSARIGRGLPISVAVDFGIQLAEAVAEAHATGIIHRDLKPANIVVTPEGRVKVLDFGLARTPDVGTQDDEPQDAVSTDSDVRRVVGTPPYVPPETFLGHGADARGDVYSLGVTLFEMLTGRRPFRGTDAGTIRAAVLTEPTPHARDVSPAVPSDLDAVVARAMARKPEERFGSAVEFLSALRAVDNVLADASTISGPHDHLRLPRVSRWWPRRVVGVAAALAVALSTYAVLRGARAPISSASADSAVVAVLPLSNTTGEPANDHLGVAIADVLVASLAQVPGVTVLSRDATLPYRRREKDVAAIARELGADLIVDGAVQASGDSVRVALSLVRPPSNDVAWSRTYDGTLADIFTLQNEVALALGDALRVTLTGQERQRLQRAPTTVVEALADYSQGRSFLERPDVPENLDRAIALFQSAIARDPRFARAHAALGQAYWRKFQRSRDQEWSEKALLETTEGLRLDPEDASTHSSLAVLYQGRGRTEQALDALRRAIALQPSNDEAHILLGQMLFDAGQRPAGVAAVSRAIVLRPNYWGHHYALGILHYDAGLYAEAQAAFRRVIELQPDSARGMYMLGTVYLAGGETAQAITTLRKAIQLNAGSGSYTNLGLALFTERRYAEAAAAFEEAVRLAPNAPSKYRNLGDVYERLGDSGKARRSYGRAVELCRDELRTNPRDARALSMMAVYEAKLGQHGSARRHAEEAIALGTPTADVVYRRAVVLALTGSPGESLTSLGQAFDRGYSRSFARADDDLISVRTRPEFQNLIGDTALIPAKGGTR